jgi:alanine dehydrogenase
MHIGIMKEPSGETRVSLLPEAVATLIGKGHTIFVGRVIWHLLPMMNMQKREQLLPISKL